MRFLRTGTKRFKRLGKSRRKKQRWRKARGRHSKIREKKKSRQRKVEIGYKKSREERGKIKGKIPVLIRNLKQAEKITKGQMVIIKKLGRKKRLATEKKIKEKGGEILNIKKNDKIGRF